jgi:hypothetical protein
MKLVSLLIAMALFATNAQAGILMYNGTSNLGVVTTFKCSTGLTCTKNGSTITAVSSPTLTGTSLSLSTTLHAAGNFDINTNKFTVAASSGNTLIAGTLALTSDFAVATNKFQVTAASGNTVVGGTLGVTGDVAVNTSSFTVAASSGNTVVGGTLNVTGATTHTGATTFTGGIALGDLFHNFMGWKPSTLTAGTSTAAVATHVYVSQIVIPHNSTLTGVYVNNAATVGTNKWIVALFNSAGAVVANSSLSGITTSGADAYQVLAFTGTYAAKTGTYWIGLYMNGTTDRFRTAPAVGQYAGYTGDITGQTFGTVATITPPTSFTADVGPVAFTY